MDISEDEVSCGLRELTKSIAEHALVPEDEYRYWGLGGQWGYGVDYENDTFMIHQYCWCEQDNCPWCSLGEFGGAPNFLHKPTQSTVHWYKYIGREMEVDMNAEWNDILSDCLKSLEKA